MIMLDTREVAVEALAVEALAVDVGPLEVVVVDVDDVIEAIALDVEPDTDPTTDPPADPTTDPDTDPVRERHLRVAPDSVRRRRHVRIAAAAAAVSISATLFAVVGFNVELAQHQIQLQKLQEKLEAAQTQYYDFRDEVAERSSPAVIEARAKALGLVGPVTPTYLVAPIPKPPQDPTGTASVQQATNKATKGSLDPSQ